jgi:HEAT repeat protein
VALADVLGFLLFTKAARHAVALVAEALGREALDPSARVHLTRVLQEVAQWRPDLLSVPLLLFLAARLASEELKDVLLADVLEPLLFTRPERLDVAIVERIETAFAASPRLKHSLALLSGLAALPASARERIRRAAVRHFPLRTAAKPVLGRQPLKVLVLNASILGQGDELVRVVPLLQALLDGNPSARVTILTKRTYLYDNTRVVPLSILDDVAIRSTLRSRFDGLLELYEPYLPELHNWRPDLRDAVDAYLEEIGSDLVLRGDLGHNRFVYQTVRLNGRDLAEEYAFDRPLLNNIYEPCLRLLTELGLPTRTGEEASSSPSLLVGVPSTDAEAVWDGLLAPTRGGQACPVALVNPFGGADRLKGYTTGRYVLLAAELAGLVREGYRVIVLPNGTPWGGRSQAEAVVALSAPDVRAKIVVAPDPAEPEGPRRLLLRERPELLYADRVMRLFKYFAARADLVVTVEGWLMHLAYNLGRRFRLVLMPGSYPYEWYPHARGPNQRLAVSLSPASGADYGATELLEDDEAAPLPHQPRKRMLQAALRGLGRLGSPRVIPLLSRAMASPDPDLRAAAAVEFGRVEPLDGGKEHLLAALRDRERRVRKVAAEVLLQRGVDCGRELGPRYADRLRAHRAAARQDWAEVERLGAAALPALAAGIEDADSAVRAEARWVLARVLERYQKATPRAEGAA